MTWRREQAFSKKIFRYAMFLSIACLFLPASMTDWLDHGIARLCRPFSRGCRDLSLSVTDKINQSHSVELTSQEYEQLKFGFQKEYAQRIHTDLQLQQYRKLIEQLSGLRQQLGFETPNLRLIRAQVLASDSNLARQIRFLDKGLEDGIQPGQIALSCISQPGESPAADNVHQPDLLTAVVIGRITEASSQGCLLQLVSDPAFSLKVRVKPFEHSTEQPDAEGILQGRGLGRCEINLLSRTRHPWIRPGDAVLAGVDSNSLPIEMLIGLVKHARPDEQNPVMWKIEMEPIAPLNTLREVIVVDCGQQGGG